MTIFIWFILVALLVPLWFSVDANWHIKPLYPLIAALFLSIIAALGNEMLGFLASIGPLRESMNLDSPSFGAAKRAFSIITGAVSGVLFATALQQRIKLASAARRRELPDQIPRLEKRLAQYRKRHDELMRTGDDAGLEFELSTMIPKLEKELDKIRRELAQREDA